MRLTIILFSCVFYNAAFGQKAPNLDSLTTVLETVYIADQQPRLLMDSLEKINLFNSPGYLKLTTEMIRQDSLTKPVVTAIIDKYGWLSAKETSEKANMALFLVIQHADLATQLKYLPVMEQAVLEGKAKASNYSFLVDRTNLKQGKFQIYGSQLNYDGKGKMYFRPIADEPNVNVRRKAVGLPTLEEHAKQIGLTYTLPKTDTLKNKIVLIVRLFENQNPLSSANVYLGNNKQIGKTDDKGFLQIAIDRTYLHWALIFRKEGYTSGSYVLDGINKDIFEINIGLEKLR